MQEKKNPWKTIKAITAYENDWIKVEHIDVLNPAGNPGIYGKVHLKNIAVGVIPLDSENYTWIVGQYRFPLNKYTWEIPEGGSPIGEDPLLSVQRELKEETGLIAKEWKNIITLHTSNSVTDEIAYIYVAKNLTQGESKPEETEDLKIKRIPFLELYEWTLKGEITDAMSVAAILKLKVLMGRGEI